MNKKASGLASRDELRRIVDDMRQRPSEASKRLERKVGGAPRLPAVAPEQRHRRHASQRAAGVQWGLEKFCFVASFDT